MRARLAVLLVVAGAWAGCADAPSRPEAGPRLEAGPVASYGDAEGPGALSQVFDVTVSSEGRVFASEPAFGRVVAFEEDGAFAGVVAERGEGPGEFRAPAKLGWVGDTLTVLDFGRGLTLLTPDGTPHGRVAFQIGLGRIPFPLHPFVLLDDGTVAAMAPVPQGMVAAAAQTTETWIRTTREGETLDTLLLRDLRGSASVVEMDGRSGSMSHPLPFDPLWMAAPDGSSFVLVERLPVVEEGGATFRVFRVGAAGDTLARAAFPYEPVPVDAAARDSIAGAVAEARAERTGLTPAELTARIVEQVRWPPHRPPVTALVPGLDGTVWLRREAPAGDSIRWEILDRELGRLGHAYLPAGLEVKAARADAVWGVSLDELDVPTVVRYRVGDGRPPRQP